MEALDYIGLEPEEEARARSIDDLVKERREGILVWHRLLDRRRLDCKLGNRRIPAVRLAGLIPDEDAGALRTELPDDPEDDGAQGEREPFYLHSESEASALLVRVLGYLTDECGEKLAFDKGEGQKDKMAEWIAREIQICGGGGYIRRHRPFVFGIELRMASA